MSDVRVDADVAVSPAVDVRAGAPADLAAFRALNDALLEVKYDEEFYATLFPRAGAGAAPAPLLFVASLPGSALCGALSARIVVPSEDAGAWWAWLCGRRPAPPPPPAAYVMTLCVAPGARRRGVANALVRALLARLAALREVGGGAPVAAVELHVLCSNAAALALYAGLGFSRVAAVRDYYHFLGASHDAVLMRLQLEAAGAAAGDAGAPPWAWPAPMRWLLAPLAGGGADAKAKLSV